MIVVRVFLAVCLLASLALSAGAQPTTTQLSPLSLVPLPVQTNVSEGGFVLTGDAAISAPAELARAIESTRLLLGPATGYAFGEAMREGEAQITFLYEPELAAEAYRLDVSSAGVRITASSEAGAFYALQTLRQLLPVSIYERTVVASTWRLPFVQIVDEPRFSWRGMHLDVGRHFMPVQFVKKYIDVLALHKMNTFHWHLTEDQGWRIEIKCYPRLTEVGATRAQTVVGNALFRDADELEYDGLPHGGFYTQEEVREVVAYAADRHITVVPEIEFPGHAQAAIAAYPELGNTGRQLKVKEEWGISKHTLKPSEETLLFYRNVLSEIIALFPSRYIHIGGDEAPKDEWRDSAYAQQRISELGLQSENELQSWMIGQLNTFLAANDRQLVGWDEIMQGGLPADAVVMSWRGMTPGLRAAEAGHDVVMAPVQWTYFDYYQGDSSSEPLAIGSYTPLRETYAFDPAPESLSPEARGHILGAQGQVWTEFIRTPDHVEYMAFPRAIALAETVWTAQAGRDYEDFLQRLPPHLERLDKLAVNYRPLGNDTLSFGSRLSNWFWDLGIDLYFWWQD
ncbi:MAG: beta-N-acetylhexosaminidase [Halioglobus sp.]